MTEHAFSLIPFSDPQIPVINITGIISRQNNRLLVHYSLTGEIENIQLPPRSAQLSRKDDLWKATCFEFFLALPDQPQYWEFNMSPSGDWNIYHMDAYRRVGFREETGISELPFSVQNRAGRILVDVTADLSPIIHVEETIQAGITSIIQTKDGYETYWALVHPNPQADFHLRESFILEL
jgi:hypothetical protein